MDTAVERRPGPPAAEHCHVVEAPGAHLQVRMRGALPFDWAGRLAGALAARRINVLRLEGQHHAAQRWDVELLLEPLDPGHDARSLDYLALARAGRGPDEAEVGALVLDAFSLTRSDDALLVDVEAVDALGFLDRILRVFALHSLFPRTLHIETRGRKVRDQFRLTGPSGQVPPLPVCEAVGLRLRDLAGPGGE